MIIDYYLEPRRSSLLTMTYSPWIDGRVHRALFLRFKEAVPSGNQTLANSNPVLAETGMEMVRWTPSGPKT